MPRLSADSSWQAGGIRGLKSSGQPAPGALRQTHKQMVHYASNNSVVDLNHMTLGLFFVLANSDFMYRDKKSQSHEMESKRSQKSATIVSSSKAVPLCGFVLSIYGFVGEKRIKQDHMCAR